MPEVTNFSSENVNVVDGEKIAFFGKSIPEISQMFFYKFFNDSSSEEKILRLNDLSFNTPVTTQIWDYAVSSDMEGETGSKSPDRDDIEGISQRTSQRMK